MRFQPGQSGNPGGRPPGSLNRKTLAAQEAMIERAQELIDSMVDRAKNGDSAAMRAAMECWFRPAATGPSPSTCR